MTNTLTHGRTAPGSNLVPDTRHQDFAEECRRQCDLVAQSDKADTSMQQFMDKALLDVDGWTE